MRIRISKRLFIAISIILILVIGLLLALYQSQKQQEIRQRAAEPNACPVEGASCEWDPVDGATSYTYSVTEVSTGAIIKGGSVPAGTTKITFTPEPNKTYHCEVKAVNDCGAGPAGEGTSTCSVAPSSTPTQTPTPTITPTLPPGVTPTLTETPTPTMTPTPTEAPTPTEEIVLTQTPTPTERPSNTPVPTRTPTVPVPTNTPAPNQPTNPPPQPTTVIVQASPQPTLAPTGDVIPTIVGAGIAVIMVIGGILLFIF